MAKRIWGLASKWRKYNVLPLLKANINIRRSSCNSITIWNSLAGGSVIALGWANVAFRERGWDRRLKMGWEGRTLNRKTRGRFQKSGIELDRTTERADSTVSLIKETASSNVHRHDYLSRRKAVLCVYMYVVYFSFTKELNLNSCPFKFSNFPFLSLSSFCLCSLFLKWNSKTFP